VSLPQESAAQLEARILGAEGHLKTVIGAAMTTYDKGEWVTLVRAQMRRQKKKEDDEAAALAAPVPRGGLFGYFAQG
jgi:hypothetical protein